MINSPSLPPLSLSLSQSLMDQYFGRIRSLMNNKELPARIRFLLQDTVELRENNWIPRKAFIDNGPKMIHQIRQEAVKVSAVKSRGSLGRSPTFQDNYLLMSNSKDTKILLLSLQ